MDGFIFASTTTFLAFGGVIIRLGWHGKKKVND